ncbi:MAG: 2-oxoacid:acceptor oxidoreductase subunit alpha [Chiayiivirga sp.]|jgi:2-oxoglutarate ferredoxin oxidoreductase subunit alpha|uniref:2-oxoacid:acceptor oxidoreductase subunit alpha n=1 Tax=Chiayiivirga sp. TaxID=2041042 RepID=UPI0025BF6021|nr:2-oxoacid:acceptor oxidoreductase subunit alpha [Chiayiivirga sp.]MCI1709532.1 2-oxoacid:acceptor oxidoreductase subunit alpha [Chiayiivirga sp.]MCI1730176.1 2-oxoacid:acceptor oxidoreductase subunit alpha [Chiayiivirga sp.]
MTPISAINDFVVKFANVNGSGSASANELFAKAILRMGVPVSPRNIFPSNIQGLPTWYEVRVTEAGWLGRRGGIDLMVAMNPQTWDADVAELEPGGYLFYDSTRPIPKSKLRDDVTLLGMPLTAICNDTYSDPRQRQLFKNIMYLGALSVLIGVDAEVIEKLFAEQYRGKEKLLDANREALRIARDWASANLPHPIGLQVRRADKVGDRIFVDGNAAAALGCVYGGATVCAWYPITPSSSLAEAFEKYCLKYRIDPESKQHRFAIIQAEDEIASIGMVVGAGWNGARAFTTTSGPGVSLMNEFIGLSYFAEIPATIIDVQRGGPSTGMPTRTQQSDLLAAAYASHGDTKHVFLLPEDPTECFEFAAAALDLADRLQTVVFVLTDLDIGMNQRLCAPFRWDESRAYDRGKVLGRADLDAGREFARYKDVEGDGIPYRTYPGTHPDKGAYFTRGTSRDAWARYSERGPDYVYNMQRLLKKFDSAKALVPQPLERRSAKPARVGAIYYGSTSPAMDEAIAVLERDGTALDTLRVRAFPFPESVREFVLSHERVFVIEQNRDAQLRSLLVNEFDLDPARLEPVLHYDGTPITARFIVREIERRAGSARVISLESGRAAS